MKPVLLEMTAFGSYAQPTTVDFRKLNHSLYLITGDTGAGKTTIFDGIMVALYGVASGKGENKARTFEMLHCDYVDKSKDTKVSLTFEHMGKSYKVERTFHFKKKRGTDDYEKTTPQAYLYEPDRDVLEKSEQVNRRITQLLGMNAEQFRKIAMLAQGEFKKFLDADSEEKNKILGELFDNSAYVYFQELFAEARKKLEQDRKEKGTEKIKRAMEDFICPEETDGENTCYSAADPELESALLALVDREREEMENFKKKENTGREQERALHEKKGRAKEQNAQLDTLLQKEKEREALLAKKESVAQLKGQVERAEKAFYKVKPAAESAAKAQSDYENAVEKAARTKERFAMLEVERKEKEQEWKACEEQEKPEVERLALAIGNMEKSIPLYGELSEVRRRQKKEQELADRARQKKQEAEERRNQIVQETARLKEQIKEREGADAKRERLDGERQRALERVEKFSSPSGIRAQVVMIREMEKEGEREKKKLQKIAVQARDLEAEYHQIYQAFLEGQAGILAKRLEHELKEKKEAVCPVCKTAFHGIHTGFFARTAQTIPEEKEVDDAREAFDRKEKERQEQSRKITGLETSVREKQAGIVSRLQELFVISESPDWDVVCADGFLEETEARFQKQKEQAQEAWRLADEQSHQLETLKKEAAGKEEEKISCDQEVEKNTDSEREHRQAVEKLQTEEKEKIKSLSFYEQCPDEESAENKKAEWEEEKADRQRKMERAQEDYHKADRQCEETKGALQTSLASLPKLEQEKRACGERLKQTLAENGLADMDEVRGILDEAGDTDEKRERWIQEKKEEVVSFENRLMNTENRVAELRDKTKDFQRIDLEELDVEMQRQSAALLDLQRQISLFTEKFNNHLKTAATVREANRTLQDTQSAWERLSSLADLANGASAAGGKLSFDRYVMGYVFKEILEMANRRLDIISGGRYELRHEMQAGRDNAAAGLEISVFDMTTGKNRPAQSLSGGESFFVSLSLALGLSDAVQNHAGGKRLDTLFIDEGFGSLDNDVLDRALAVLNQLTEGNRLVGIISHVARLNESIPQQIRVKNGERGSSLTIVS